MEQNSSEKASATSISDTPAEINTPQTRINATVLGNARKLVEDKTRFEPDDVQPVGEQQEQIQPYTITVGHFLFADPTVKGITGHFVPESQDRHTLNPDRDAQKEVATQLHVAAEQLKVALARPGRVYNQIEPGLLLAHPHKHWFLHTCSPCGGRGKVTCDPCHGRGSVTCYSCHGSRRVTCDGWGCIGGKVNCSVCYGTGTVKKSVPYQVSRSVNVNGNWQTQWTTEYKTEFHLCGSCSNGKKTCTVCGGMGTINCRTCNASGELQCSRCHGSGHVDCIPCEASGRVGVAAWVDVRIRPGYTYQLPEDTPPDVIEMASKEGEHGLPPISESFQFEQAQIYQPKGVPEAVVAKYQGKFKVARQEVICENESAHLVAYGNDLRWKTLDGIIERLLQDDLKALSNAIVASETEGAFSSKIDLLLDRLKHVAASEINVDIVEAALGNRELTGHDGAVSEEYRTNVKHSLQAALRRIYVRQSMSLAWKSMLASLLIGLAVWAFAGKMWGGATVAGVIFAGVFAHKISIRNILTKTLGDQEIAKRAIGVATKGTGGREAILLLTLPSMILALMIGWILPANAPFGHAGSPVSSSASSDTLPDPAPEQTSPQQAATVASAARNQAPRSSGHAQPKLAINSQSPSSHFPPAPASQSQARNSPVAEGADGKLDSMSESNLRLAEKFYAGGFFRNAYNHAQRVLAAHPGNGRAIEIAANAKSRMQIPKQQDQGGGTDASLDPRSATQLKIAQRMLDDGYYYSAYEMARRVLDSHPGSAQAEHIASTAQVKLQGSQGK